MIIKTHHLFCRFSIAAGILTLAGCSAMPPFLGGQAAHQAFAGAGNPSPFVQDCGIVSIGSPTKYACNGKVYTSFDLAKLRLDWEKSHGG
jgi:hypothetical protein